VAVLSGFGTERIEHVRQYGLDYPLIVHFHAVAFVGWLALFTVQALLIRNTRQAASGPGLWGAVGPRAAVHGPRAAEQRGLEALSLHLPRY